MKKRIIKNRLALYLAGSMLVATIGNPILAAKSQTVFEDVKGHWAESAIERMSDYNLVNGYKGLFRPSDSITRGEMSVIISKIMGYQNKSSNEFKDLGEAFYTDAVLKAYHAGLLLEEEGKVRPTDYLTRQEAAVMIYNAFEIQSDTQTIYFADMGQIASWAKEAVDALSSKGIMVGNEGKFRPTAEITRAEIVAVLDKLLKEYYNISGEYSNNIQGTVVINAEDTILRNSSIKGDLIIAEGVRDGDVILDNVSVEGRTIIRGGGTHSIKVRGKSHLESVLISRDGKGVRLQVDETAKVTSVKVDKEAAEAIISGKVEKVVVEEVDAKLELQDASIQNVEVMGQGTILNATGKTSVESFTINKTGTNTIINVQKEAMVKDLVTEAKVLVEGEGNVTNVKANASDVVVNTKNTKVEAAQGTTGVMAGKNPIKGGSTASTNTPSFGGGGGSGSSSGGSSGGSGSAEEKPEGKPEVPEEKPEEKPEVPEEKPEEKPEVPEVPAPSPSPTYPDEITLYAASEGSNKKGVGDTTYEVLKEIGWKEESSNTLSVNGGRIKFENVDGVDDIDAIVTLKAAPEEEDKDALYLLSLMIGPDSTLTYEGLVELIANGSNNNITDGTRKITIQYDGQISYTIKITFSNFAEPEEGGSAKPEEKPEEPDTKPDVPEVPAPQPSPTYPDKITLYAASEGSNKNGVGDTTYEVLKEIGWKEESSNTLSVNGGRIKFENVDGVDDIDAIVTLKASPEEEDKDALYLLSLMIGPDSTLTYERLVELIANGSNNNITDGTRKITVRYNGQISYTITVTFSNFAEIESETMVEISDLEE